MRKLLELAAAALLAVAAGSTQAADKVELLNASYDVSRELFRRMSSPSIR